MKEKEEEEEEQINKSSGGGRLSHKANEAVAVMLCVSQTIHDQSASLN